MPMVREGLCTRYACSVCPGSPYELPGIVGEEIWGKLYAYVAAGVHARLLRSPWYIPVSSSHRLLTLPLQQ